MVEVEVGEWSGASPFYGQRNEDASTRSRVRKVNGHVHSKSVRVRSETCLAFFQMA